MSEYFWIARDLDGTLMRYESKPWLEYNKYWDRHSTMVGLCRTEFPEIKPGERVRFRLVRDDEEGEKA